MWITRWKNVQKYHFSTLLTRSVVRSNVAELHFKGPLFDSADAKRSAKQRCRVAFQGSQLWVQRFKLRTAGLDAACPFVLTVCIHARVLQYCGPTQPAVLHALQRKIPYHHRTHPQSSPASHCQAAYEKPEELAVPYARLVPDRDSSPP